MLLSRLSLTLCLTCSAALAMAQDWPQWRGPHTDGSSAETGLPDRLDDSTKVWSVDLPGPGAGTPAVVGDKVFISALDAKTQNLLALCYDRASGKPLWNHDVGVGYTSNKRNDMAAPSPICDGKRVIFSFGSGDIVAYDLGGKALWSRNLQKQFGKFNIQWIYASTPLLHEGRLIVQVLQRDDEKGDTPEAASFILGIDPASGKDLWKHQRPCGAKAESQESYATPVPFATDGKPGFAVMGGDCVTGHDAVTGKELWRCEALNPNRANNWRVIPSPMVADGRVVVLTARGSKAMAVTLGGKGDVTASHLAWNSGELTSDVAVPGFYQGKLYVLDGDKKVLTCADPKTGAKLWSGGLEGGTAPFRASPTLADGKAYCIDEAGAVRVLALEPFSILSKSELGGDGTTRASIAIAHGQVFVRTSDKLYAFAKR